ncbi:NAD(P)H-dependent flavin oxidoreductase [Bradymonas sediminis]|uniref:Nitronate monooxygenase n=1 Tax=Bradymonas sediminis TaxID=1548548 RepID=A0A2Z4FQY2_9DELT|nr:nitronate monooxygenase [Bradymonas sediminis]AWV91175.1 nitronate monooxygenase [Bradymonas sediminis]TDP73738.1 nitronate monooxygenase [Bradymonas sediminis]
MTKQPAKLETRFTEQVGIEVPLICGAMYPCSNLELIAAASEAGGIGIIQPISLMFVHGHDLREGIREIRKLTDKPIGFNALVEQSSQVYEDRMKKWVDIAIEEGVRFFITALGSPDWVVKKVHAVGGVVYHDVTTLKWAKRAIEGGVDGLICVNKRAGGHAGEESPQKLLADLKALGVPLICAGGIGDEAQFIEALEMGYDGVQMGTRFIATTECSAHIDYKHAILEAEADDIVLTEKISGIPVAVIQTEYVKKVGTHASWLAKKLLQHPKGKHYMRGYYTLKSLWQLKSASTKGMNYKDYFQAGKSVDGITKIESVADIVSRFADAVRAKAPVSAEAEDDVEADATTE